MEHQTDTLAGFFRSWWESCASRSERTALVVLSLICITTIFSTALVQALVVILTGLFALLASPAGCGGQPVPAEPRP